MVSSQATTVEKYLEELPEDRRRAIEKVRQTIRKNLPDGYREGMMYGMISYFIPLATYRQTYNGQPLTLASLASQKNHMALYLSNIYADKTLAAWFKKAYEATGNKLDMGKSCVRFKKLEQLPLTVIGQAIAKTPPADFIASYEAARSRRKH